MAAKLSKKSYIIWTERCFLNDEICPMIGGWKWFDTFDSLEHYIKSQCMLDLLYSTFEVEEGLTIEEIIESVCEPLTGIQRHLLLDLLEFSKSKDYEYKRLVYKLVNLILRFKTMFATCYDIQVFSNYKEAIYLLLKHLYESGKNISLMELEKNMQYWFEADIV